MHDCSSVPVASLRQVFGYGSYFVYWAGWNLTLCFVVVGGQQDLDVDESGGLEAEEINDWLTSVCGWSDAQV